jgi:putative copper resistance protein D
VEADAPLVLARWAYYCGTTALFGSSLFELYGVDRPRKRDGVVAKAVMMALATASVAGAVLWLICFANSIGDPEDVGTTVQTILFDSGFGFAWLVRLSALALALVAAVMGSPHIVACTMAIALGCEGWTGHAAAFGMVGSLLQAVHVLCAGAWIGGLLPLGLLVMRARSDAAAVPVAEMAVRRFSRCGLLVVVALALTGVANHCHIREGRLDLGIDYDRVLLAKVALFGIMVAIAALNRWALVSRFGRSGLAAVASQLSRNIAAEQLLGAAILLAASMLGLMNPHG